MKKRKANQDPLTYTKQYAKDRLWSRGTHGPKQLKPAKDDDNYRKHT